MNGTSMRSLDLPGTTVTELAPLPALLTLSVAELVMLPAVEKARIQLQLKAAADTLRQAVQKFEAALEVTYGAAGRDALRESGRDFGAARCFDGDLQVVFELPKRVSWDQQRLAELAERIVSGGEKVEHYIDAKLSVPESRFKNWPPALQAQFSGARTVEPGKPSITLMPRGEEAV
jgi:hypothetical protein